MKSFIILLLLLIGAPFSAMADTGNITKKILFIAGDTKHRHGFHEYKAGSILLANALNESKLGIEAQVHWYGWPKDESIFDGIDACIIYADNGGNFGEKYAFLDKKVKEGMGIMFMHYGVHPTKNIGEKYYKDWIGGYYDDDYSVNPSWIADISPKSGHPVSNGINQPVRVYDELYWNLNFKKDCADCYPLATATPTKKNMIRYGSSKFWNKSAYEKLGEKQALIWCHAPKEGGRGAGFVGGHYHNNWAIDNYRKLVLNTIAWVARVEIPEGGIPSKKVTKAMLNKNLNRPDFPEEIELPSPDLFKQAPGKVPELGADGRAIDKRRKKIKKLPAVPIPKSQNQGTEKKTTIESTKKKPVRKGKPSYSWPATEPENVSLELFSHDENVEITRWASTPQLYNPTNMDIDQYGRIWVTEAVNYRLANEYRRKHGDRIVVLTDTNGDGKADKSQVFHQDKNLAAPLGIAVFDNKIIVSQPPEILIYTDTNRNLKFDVGVDKKEVLLTGFNGRQHDHSLHSITAGPDGKWYFNSGNCGAIFTDNSGKTFRMNSNYRGGSKAEYFYMPQHELNGAKSDDGFVWSSGFTVRMNPDGTKAEIIGHGFRNSYEQTVNSFGEVFQSDNDDYSSCRNSYVLEYGSAGYYSRDGQYKWQSERRPGQAIPRAHWRQDNPGYFDTGDVYGAGGPTGVCFYENGALGDKWQGMYLSCEATRNTVYGYFPEENGATYKLDRFNFLTTHKPSSKVESEEESDKRIMFRPSDIAVGPDGAIYIADWYDARSGGHSTLDPSASGAIYRIAPKNFKTFIPKLDLSTLQGQLEALKSPAANVRFLGFNALKASGAKALPLLTKLLEHHNKFIAARAIWLLPHLGDKGRQKCISLLKHQDSKFRMVAYRALRRVNMNILPFAKQLAKDPNTAVRREVALSMRHYSAKESREIFVDLVQAVGSHYDQNYIEAIGLGAENKEDAIWLTLKESLSDPNPLNWSESFARVTWRLWPKLAIQDLKTRASSSKLPLGARKFAVESLAFIKHKSAALALIDLSQKESPIQESIINWLIMKRLTDWSSLDIADEIKNIYDPKALKVQAITVPEEPKEKTLKLERILDLKGNADRGKQKIMSCTMCHKIDEMGPNYGPMLKGWASKQTREATVTAIISPSRGLAHGFKGIEVTLKNGDVIQGIPESQGDPVILVSTGGLRQIIPKERIAKKSNMKRSLMLSAQQLGLSEQDVADIVEYMKNWQ